MASESPWDAYLYPETLGNYAGGTLRNLFGERNPMNLRLLEYVHTSDRATELIEGTAEVPRTYDAEHHKAIHRHLFQDVYSWAGDYRTVNMAKGDTSFANVDDGEVDAMLSYVRNRVEQTAWTDIPRDQFIERIAEVQAVVNQAHPFREGNGRAAKVFLEHVAEQSPFQLRFREVDPSEWKQANAASAPRYDGGPLYAQPLMQVFDKIVVDKPANTTPEPLQNAQRYDRAQGLTTELSAAAREARQVSAYGYSRSTRDMLNQTDQRQGRAAQPAKNLPPGKQIGRPKGR